jgi:Bax protein
MEPKMNFSRVLRLVVIGIAMLVLDVSAKTVPDFASMKDVKQKKHAFFEYIYPLIEVANNEVLVKRKKLEHVMDDFNAGDELTPGERKFLVEVADEYSLKIEEPATRGNVEKLLRAVDYVPPSLALAQAANQSAWGTSRFATQANNFFGQWCFTKGCGIVPARRDAGSKHEVRKFSTTQGSVRSYVRNINTARTYSSLRTVRANARRNESMLTGHDLAAGLVKHSTRGDAYVKEIRSMIRTNKLKNYDEKFWNASVVN